MQDLSWTRQRIALGVLVAATATAIACAAAVAAPAKQTKFACEGGKIVVGIAKAKTGGFAFFDAAGAKGAISAMEDYNKRGGIDGCKFKWIWDNTKSDPALAEQVGKSLINKGAQLLDAPSDFDIGVGASLAAKKAGIFAFSPEASSVDWPKAAGSNFAIQAITTDDLGTAQAIFANQRNWKTGYVVSNKAFNFFTAMESSFKAHYKGKIVGQDVVQDDQSDYSANISKIRALNPQPSFIYLNDYFPHVGTFIKQMRDAGIKTTILGNSTYSAIDFPKVVGPTRMGGIYYMTQSFYEGPTASKAVRAFDAAYKKRWGNFPENLNCIAAYEGIQLLAAALKKAGSTDAAAVSKAMQSQKNFRLSTGARVYEWVNGHTVRSVDVIAFNKKGQFIRIGQIDPRKA